MHYQLSLDIAELQLLATGLPLWQLSQKIWRLRMPDLNVHRA